jgi:hypothetical protein
MNKNLRTGIIIVVVLVIVVVVAHHLDLGDYFRKMHGG